jgi:hypothetical protein
MIVCLGAASDGRARELTAVQLALMLRFQAANFRGWHCPVAPSEFEFDGHYVIYPRAFWKTPWRPPAPGKPQLCLDKRASDSCHKATLLFPSLGELFYQSAKYEVQSRFMTHDVNT